MSQQTIAIGSTANDGNGDTLRAGAVKINENFTELYTALGLAGRTYKWAVNGADTPNSLVHESSQAAFAVGDIVRVLFYASDNDPESGGLLYCAATRASDYGGTYGDLVNGGSTGLIIEGRRHRWKIIPTAGGIIDIRRAGIRCVEGVTGWHSRFSNACAFAKNQSQVALTGAGVLTCSETVYLDRVNWIGDRLRFQGGTHQPNGATSGPSTFFTAAQSNTPVTITAANPAKLSLNAGATAPPANDTLIYLTTNGKLPGSLAIWQSGVGNGLQPYYVKNRETVTNTFEVSLTLGGASVSTASGGSGYGDHYVFIAATQSNITTQDIVEWSGKGVRLGIVVRAGTNGSNKDFGEQKIVVWGDGNSDRTTPPSCICVRHESDDSPNGEYRYVVNYGYVGVGIQGPAEKHSLQVHGIYQRHLVYLLANASADTLRTSIHGTNCQAWVTECEGTDTSVIYDLDCESRDDPAADASADSPTSPSLLFQNGKVSVVSGEIRASNGVNDLIVVGRNNGVGSSARVGADTMNFKEFQFIHGYGTIDLRAARYISGKILLKDRDDPNGTLAQDAPAFRLGRVVSASQFYVHAVAIKNVIGLQVGDADALDMEAGEGYYSKEAHLGHWSIDMGTVVQFNPDGTERSGSSAHPTTLTAVKIEKWDNCYIDLTGTRGNIILGAACEGGTVLLDPLMKLFTIDDDSSATIGYPTLSTTGLTFI